MARSAKASSHDITKHDEDTYVASINIKRCTCGCTFTSHANLQIQLNSLNFWQDITHDDCFTEHLPSQGKEKFQCKRKHTTGGA